MDEVKGKVLGVVDPGTKPDPKRHWLAYVNSACYLWQQNIVAVQYRGDIWYRVVQPIAPGDELLTHYGESYSKTLGIHKNFRLTKEEVAALNVKAAEAKHVVGELCGAVVTHGEARDRFCSVTEAPHNNSTFEA